MHLLTDFQDNLHLTYPHNNGWCDGGAALVAGGIEGDEVSLWKCALSGERRKLCAFKREAQPEKLLWADVSLEANLAVTIADNAVVGFDLDHGAPPRLLFPAPRAARLHPIPGIRPDGRRMVFGLYTADRYSAALLDLQTGSHRILFEKPWFANHFHFCPFDPEWIGFSHEGNCAEVLDRVWAWHPREAPEGRCFFDQHPAGRERLLYAGHERWSFHDRSVLVVAYGESPGRPRGLYEAFVDGRPTRLVSEGDRDSHLDVSRDGRWIAVDTTGAHDAPGKGWENAWPITDVLVVDRASGERRFVARSRLAKHPSHAHPVFSPDGRFVCFNEASEDGARNRIWRAANPFLA